MTIVKCTEQEQLFYKTILLPVISSKYIFPQHSFIEPSGKQRYIDFAIITPQNKIAIEMDGIESHGYVSQEKFADDRYRQNELQLADWQVLRFSWVQFKKQPQDCIQQIKRATSEDQYINPNNNKEISHFSHFPHQNSSTNVTQPLKSNPIKKESGAKPILIIGFIIVIGWFISIAPSSPSSSSAKSVNQSIPPVQQRQASTSDSAPIKGYKRINIPDVGFIDFPSDIMEEQVGSSPANLANNIIIQQKRSDKYARIMVSTIKGKRGDFKPLSINYKLNNSDLKQLNERLKNNVTKELSTIPNMKLLDFYPAGVEVVNGNPTIFFSYIRQLGTNPPVEVWRYMFENNDRLIELTISFRQSETSTWESIMPNVVKSFRITNIIN